MSRFASNIQPLTLTAKIIPDIFLPKRFEMQSTFNSVEIKLRKNIRNLILFFIIALIISGGTAFFIETGLSWAVLPFEGSSNAMALWLQKTYLAMKDINQRYPFMAYGYDWLAFAHLVIAVAFIGPLRDPVRNVWIIQFGMIACVMIIPLALLAGYVRQIPFFWQLIDCSFGIIGILPLANCLQKIKKLEALLN
jgi:hypothetical protein